YEDFIEHLQQEGIKDEPILTDYRREQEKQRCYVPGCNGATAPGWSFNFEPHKQPGYASACDAHKGAIGYVKNRLNGQRLIRYWAQPRKRTSDPDAAKRRNAIVKACAKYKGNVPNYLERVCEELQTKHIKLPTSLLERWKTTLS